MMKLLSLLAIISSIPVGLSHISNGYPFSVWVYPFTTAIWAFLCFLAYDELEG